MSRSFATLLALSIVVSCHDNDLDSLVGTYQLISENGKLLPADPNDEGGCCITLSGSLSFSRSTYQLSITYQNKNTSVIFENSEYGSFELDGDLIRFDRLGGSGINVPFLLSLGTVDGNQVEVRYGDEGPGSDQIVALFER